MNPLHLSDAIKEQIIEFAWEDSRPFEKIEARFGLTELEVINLMCSQMQVKSFEQWRKRVAGKFLKPSKKIEREFKCCQQKQNCSFAS